MAFDLEETQPACPLQGNCSCSGGLCGSGHFVQNFSTFLSSSGVGFQGALILETILNHNTTPNSQDIPQSLQTVLPAVHDKVAKNNFTGDFLAVIGRLANDEGLIKGITNAFKQDGKYSVFKMDRRWDSHDLFSKGKIKGAWNIGRIIEQSNIGTTTFLLFST